MPRLSDRVRRATAGLMAASHLFLGLAPRASAEEKLLACNPAEHVNCGSLSSGSFEVMEQKIGEPRREWFDPWKKEPTNDILRVLHKSLKARQFKASEGTEGGRKTIEYEIRAGKSLFKALVKSKGNEHIVRAEAASPGGKMLLINATAKKEPFPGGSRWVIKVERDREAFSTDPAASEVITFVQNLAGGKYPRSPR
ncbi:MAG: hypothetical protein NTY90_00135 [Candidatus Micrarchaeota archaeon]|nr:hypothetical protein [Candidatus Micrarchaeota archaeon]